MATVIYSNFGDPDTKVLCKLWERLENVKVIEITSSTKDSKLLVDKAIKDEKDLLIMCGHGGPDGLFSPDLANLHYLINSQNVGLIKAEKVIGIWCFASEFAKKNQLHGFFSNMFISNATEAGYFGVIAKDSRSITLKEIDFCKNVCDFLKNDVPVENWIANLKNTGDMNDEVVKYNYNGLAYYV